MKHDECCLLTYDSGSIHCARLSIAISDDPVTCFKATCMLPIHTSIHGHSIIICVHITTTNVFLLQHIHYTFFIMDELDGYRLKLLLLLKSQQSAKKRQNTAIVKNHGKHSN